MPGDRTILHSGERCGIKFRLSVYLEFSTSDIIEVFGRCATFEAFAELFGTVTRLQACLKMPPFFDL